MKSFFFPKRISQHFRRIPIAEVNIDDILVWGENKEEHDQRLRKVSERGKEINLTLSKENMYSIVRKSAK